MYPSAELTGRQGKQTGLANGVEGQCEQGTDCGNRHGIAGALRPSQKPPRHAHRPDNFVARRRDSGAQTDAAQKEPEVNGNPYAAIVKSAWYGPACGQDAGHDRNRNDDCAVTE